MKLKQYLNESKKPFSIILKDGDIISYTIKNNDWMRAYNDEKSIQAFDLNMWNKDKIVAFEGKNYKIDKVKG
jgi:hypothetical protein